MCGPLAIPVAMLAIGTASAVMQHQSAKAAASAQNAYAQQNAQAAMDAAWMSYADIQARQLQEQSAAAQELETINRDTRQDVATARVAAGEAGVAGLSVDALLGDLYGAAARKRASVETNRDWTVEQLQREQLGIQAGAKDRIASVRTVRPPAPLQLGLGIAQAGLQSYSAYSRISEGASRGTPKGYSRVGDGRTDNQ